MSHIRESQLASAQRQCEPQFDSSRWSREHFDRYVVMIVDAGVQFDADMCDEVSRVLIQLARQSAVIEAAREWASFFIPRLRGGQYEAAKNKLIEAVRALDAEPGPVEAK